MKRKHLGDRSRYILIISALLLLVNVTMGIFLINLSRGALITQIEGRMLRIGNDVFRIIVVVSA